jgi:type I restriction enzyme M protein
MSFSCSSSEVHRKRHGQYYTDKEIGSLLVRKMSIRSVDTAIELGVGPGNLLNAVRNRWPHAKCISVDIDPNHKRASKQRLHFCVDALRSDLTRKIGVDPDSADVAVCNPPFTVPNWKSSFSTILQRAKLPMPTVALTVEAEVLFLAQNLWILRKNGQMGIIVPDGLISGGKLRAVRDALLERHAIREVIELPCRAFNAIEVKTHILLLRKDSSSDKPIKLSRYNIDGCLDTPICISQDEASERLDFSYYQWKRSSANVNSTSAKRSPLTVTRGRLTTAEAAQAKVRVLHTTSMPKFPSADFMICKNFSPGTRHGDVVAKKGDVLVARVGRNAEEKTVLVKSGKAVISDCILIIRSAEFDPEKVFRALTSELGKSWIRANSRGACARFITKEALLSFPLKEICRQFDE